MCVLLWFIDCTACLQSSQESQEVVFCGEKGFRTKFNNLCDESDQLYNQWISSNQSVERRDSVDVSSSYEQPRHYVPSRFVQPSRFKSSPYGDNRIRTSVSALELMHFDAIVRISDIENLK